jgi:hypothetical protein
VVDGTVEVEVVTGGMIIRQIDEKGQGKEDKGQKKKYLIVDERIYRTVYNKKEREKERGRKKERIVKYG